MLSASIEIETLVEWGDTLIDVGNKMKSAAVPETVTIAVRSVDQNNKPVVGYFTTFTPVSGEPQTGFTPCDFSMPSSNLTTKVAVSDYGDAKFLKWSDGVTGRERAVRLDKSVILTAVYNVGTPSPTPTPPPPAGSAKAGVFVALYTYPTHPSWNGVIAAKNANPTVPIIAVVNPSSGVGRVGRRSGGLFVSTTEKKLIRKQRGELTQEQKDAVMLESSSWRFQSQLVKSRAIDSNYSAGIKKLKAAGIKVLGYVSTRYGNRSATEIKSEIDTWYSWYPEIEGIFFDEQPNWGGFEAHYKALSAHVKSKNPAHVTIGNPGADSIPSYLSTVDIVLIYESPGLPNLSGYSTKWGQYNNFQLGMIPFGVPSLPEQWVRDCAAFVGWIYVTNDVLSNPWDSIPPYFGNLVTLIGRL